MTVILLRLKQLSNMPYCLREVNALKNLEGEDKGNPLLVHEGPLLRRRFCSLVTIRPWCVALPLFSQAISSSVGCVPRLPSQPGSSVSPSPWPCQSLGHSFTLGLSLNSTSSLILYFPFLPVRINFLFPIAWFLYLCLPCISFCLGFKWVDGMWYSFTSPQASAESSFTMPTVALCIMQALNY